MRFQCLDVTCGKPFGWTAKKIVNVIEEDKELPVVYEYVICPYCGSLDFEEYTAKPVPKLKPTPPVQMPTPVTQTSQFDPADLMSHSWKGKKLSQGKYAPANDNYGWDFTETFQQATVAALGRGKVNIDDREFELKGKIVSMKRVDK